jgi:hypothetical protein
VFAFMVNCCGPKRLTRSKIYAQQILANVFFWFQRLATVAVDAAASSVRNADSHRLRRALRINARMAGCPFATFTSQAICGVLQN